MKRLLQYSLLAVSLMAPAGPAFGKTSPMEGVGLTVCLMNEAGVPAAMEDNVERQVEALMEHAAIHIRWLDAADPGRTAEVRCVCSHPEPMRVVILHWMKTGRRALPSELGQAFLGEDGQGVAADLFLERIGQITEERNVNFAQMLAHVTAHELGHLLLGANSHTAAGLMQARIDEETLARMAQGSFGFSRKQVEKMRERMSAAGGAANWWRSAVSCPDSTTRARLDQADAM